ncbi:recombinase family protein [Demequina muriae]|uniref:Recombinase family protein n=1 Tax=Demequina muriae TaxID=3051664 RepID=A0ABT8GEP1_9MICO|nr:recombinase family protein [Demequina sp. EGI L300058]MDN4479902.1 recombinase family protein [Demequina sp. EGI L300058]
MATTRRAITLGRQSREREDKSAGSPEMQKRETRRFVEEKGWDFVEHFEDLGRSGWDKEAPRPGLDAALAAIEDRTADTLVVYRLDRLTRQGLMEAASLLKRITDAGGRLVSATESDIDVSSSMGAMQFAMLSAFAKQESENISTRTRKTKAELRLAGSHMSGQPPYGMRAVRAANGRLVVRMLEPYEAEAKHVRDAFSAVRDGRSIAEVAREMNARGLRTRPTSKRPDGAEWTTSALSRLLRNPTIAGYMPETRSQPAGSGRASRDGATPRDERGRIAIARDADNNLFQPWAPIVDPGQWHELQDALDKRPRLRGKTKTPSLLGGNGLLRCAECGGPMFADRARTRAAYRCSWHRTGRTRLECPGVSVALDPTDDFVALAVFSRLATLAPTPMGPDDDDSLRDEDAALLLTLTERFAAREEDPETTALRARLRETIAQLEGALYRLDDDRQEGFYDGALGTERYRRQSATLSAKYAKATEALEQVPVATGNGLVPWLDALSTTQDPNEGPLGDGSIWAKWDVAERRDFLALVIDHVRVRKGTRNGGVFDAASRLEIRWATGPSTP